MEKHNFYDTIHFLSIRIVSAFLFLHSKQKLDEAWHLLTLASVSGV